MYSIFVDFNQSYSQKKTKKTMSSKKLHTTSCIIRICSGYKRRNDKSMHSYSLMCEKYHIYNYIRRYNICDECTKKVILCV